MNTQLDSIAARIRRLRSEVVEAERDERDDYNESASTRALFAKSQLTTDLNHYFDAAERARRA